jgi:hypothetical protein
VGGGNMKNIIIIIFMVLALVVTATADTSLPISLTKPLCSFPFGNVAFVNGPITYSGGLLVQYDGRFYDDTYAKQNSMPNGGIRFALELGYYANSTDRDNAVAKVINVTFVNTTHGSTHILTQAGKYSLTDRFNNTSHVADYNLFFGYAANAIGNWKVYLVHRSGIYSAEFSITEDMIEDSLAPIPVDITSVASDKVCFNSTAGATEYRVRVFDDEGNFIFDRKLTGSGQLCQPLNFPGYSGRVEARLVSGYWISLIIPCSADGKNVFSSVMNSRASTYFTLPPLPK